MYDVNLFFDSKMRSEEVFENHVVLVLGTLFKSKLITLKKKSFSIFLFFSSQEQDFFLCPSSPENGMANGITGYRTDRSVKTNGTLIV